MAKKFFYVCAGLFLVAASFHIGGSVARAQFAGTITAASLSYCGGNCAYAVVGRVLFGGSTGINVTPTPHPAGPVPGTEPIIAVGPGAGGAPLAMLANGDVYWAGGVPSGTWILVGNVIAGATGTQRESMGSLKVRYR